MSRLHKERSNKQSSRQLINQRLTRVSLINQIDMNTQENNKMIAEFMGDYNFEHTEGGLPIGDFSNSWDWLMPVVEKIYEIAVDDENVEVYYEVSDNLPHRHATYKAVVEFINQYNK